jgi:hypothetical protein
LVAKAAFAPGQNQGWLPPAVPPVWFHGADFISVVHIWQSLSRRALALINRRVVMQNYFPLGTTIIVTSLFYFGP